MTCPCTGIVSEQFRGSAREMCIEGHLMPLYGFMLIRICKQQLRIPPVVCPCSVCSCNPLMKDNMCSRHF